MTKLSLFLTNNPATVTIDADGRVQPINRGDSHVFARFDRFTIGSEVIVLPKGIDFKWSSPPAANYIDELVYDRLKQLYMLPSDLCDEETFLRRIYLDLSGLPPTIEQAVEAGQAAAATGSVPAYYPPLTRWARVLFVSYAVTGFLALAAYGGSWLLGGLAPAWAGWVTLVFSLAVLGLLLVQGDTLPAFHYLPPLLLGIILLLSS